MFSFSRSLILLGLLLAVAAMVHLLSARSTRHRNEHGLEALARSEAQSVEAIVVDAPSRDPIAMPPTVGTYLEKYWGSAWSEMKQVYIDNGVDLSAAIGNSELK